MQSCALKSITGMLGALVCASAVQAQPYPARPIRLIIPVQPGLSTNDSIPRAFARQLSTAFGQTVVTDNRPGASGQIASEMVAKSAPDGYTLLVGYTTTLGIGPSVHEKLPYDPDKDLVPVARLFVSSYVVAVNTTVPANTLKELIDLAKAKPGQLHYASAGTGSTPHLCGELLRTMTGINIVHIPYKASGSAMTALAGGEAQIGCQAAGTYVPLIKAGKMRALAVAAPQRLPTFPELPTAAEAGLPGYEVQSWTGYMAPAKTPPAILRRLYDELAKIIETPEMKNFILSQGAEPALMDSATFGAYIKTERVKWAKVVKAAGIKAQ